MKRWGGQASCRPHPANTPSPYPPVPASPAPPLKCFTVEDPRDELQQETVRGEEGGQLFPQKYSNPPPQDDERAAFISANKKIRSKKKCG